MKYMRRLISMVFQAVWSAFTKHSPISNPDFSVVILLAMRIIYNNSFSSKQ
jgi:hypothetical protein